MANETTRRAVLKGGLAAAGLGMLGLPEWALPALAQGESLVPFTDVPDEFGAGALGPTRRVLDIRTIDGPLTDRNDFYTIQHFDQPEIAPGAFRLKVSGLVDRPAELSLDDLRGMGETGVVAGFECSGNSPRMIQGLASNGRWSGVPLRAVLERAGLQARAREIVFFGADHGEEAVDFRGQTHNVDQPFARSMPRADAMMPEPLLAYALNGEALTREQGFPLRLVVPGWYGVCNVKWLNHIRVQADRFLGKWQARWYRTLWAEEIDGEVSFHETEISRLRVKSVIARVTRSGNRHTVHGFVLHDGTELQSVEVSVDGGAWRPATLDRATASDTYSWKLFRYDWDGATPGEHTLVSRATDVDGRVQPTADELEFKQTGLENHQQYPRTVRVS
ncbi:MAG: molybdopterin-dependent oxidoreductase [Acidobacteria bacterium]|nr:molybdopterin-dependent oxidoreductase [Acidobacteriota bacterium]MYI75358.1 molybdopterin-dependent oxidoreductase [Acidobacteriota bacterium]